VEDVRDKVGYAVGPLSDYATVDIDGVKDNLASTMMHEISHVCNNWHWHPLSNLIYPDSWKNGRTWTNKRKSLEMSFRLRMYLF
jgi:hypothetical protein